MATQSDPFGGRSRTGSDAENVLPHQESSLWVRKMTQPPSIQPNWKHNVLFDKPHLREQNRMAPSGSPPKMEKGWSVGMKEYIHAGFEPKSSPVDVNTAGAPEMTIPPSKYVAAGLKEYIHTGHEHKPPMTIDINAPEANAPPSKYVAAGLNEYLHTGHEHKAPMTIEIGAPEANSPPSKYVAAGLNEYIHTGFEPQIPTRVDSRVLRAATEPTTIPPTKYVAAGLKEYLHTGFEHKPYPIDVDVTTPDAAPRAAPFSSPHTPSKLERMLSGGLREYVSGVEHKVHDYKAEPTSLERTLMEDMI